MQSAIILIICAAVSAFVPANTEFTELPAGKLCISDEFTQTLPEARSLRHCGFLCSERSACQAFSVADGPCRLFEFGRCSKRVRACSCNHTGSVFVKRQPGLAKGALCPDDFGDENCGTKYKLLAGVTSWPAGKAAIDALPGLVIMSDVIDSSELAYLHDLVNRKLWAEVMLGVRQLPGSVEPNGGWIWTDCGIAFNASFWQFGEPSNSGGHENIVTKKSNTYLLKDSPESYGTYSGALAECVSPFE